MGESVAMGEEVFLQVRNLSKSFGGVRAVNDLSFELYKGEILGIIGPNGSGKTTLLNLVTGFVRKDSGRYFLKIMTSPIGQPTRLVISAWLGPFK